MIHARGGRVVLECKKPLHRLFQSLPGVIAMAELGDYSGHVDFHIPMMSLPRIFKTDSNAIPPCPALTAAPSLPAEVLRLFDLAGPRLKVGIVWSGSTTFANNKKRAYSYRLTLSIASV